MAAADSHEFLSLTAPAHDAAGLAQQLTDHSADGWEVVSIVSTGGQLAAFVRRPTDKTAGEPAVDSAAAAPSEPEAPTASESPFMSSSPSSSSSFDHEAPAQASPVETAGGWAAATSAPEPAPVPAPQAPVQQAPAQSTPAVPAGWYADPSGRFELRYWDGGTWTEHVARNGQQYTDAPVA